jgi:hypothetical protein
LLVLRTRRLSILLGCFAVDLSGIDIHIEYTSQAVRIFGGHIFSGRSRGLSCSVVYGALLNLMASAIVSLSLFLQYPRLSLPVTTASDEIVRNAFSHLSKIYRLFDVTPGSASSFHTCNRAIWGAFHYSFSSPLATVFRSSPVRTYGEAKNL